MESWGNVLDKTETQATDTRVTNPENNTYRGTQAETAGKKIYLNIFYLFIVFLSGMVYKSIYTHFVSFVCSLGNTVQTEFLNQLIIL